MRSVLSTVCGVLVLLLASCSSDVSPGASAAPPSHPAMHEPPSRVAGEAGPAGAGRAALPPDHPPIRPTAGADGSAGTGGATAGSAAPRAPAGRPADGAGLKARLQGLGIDCDLPEGWIEETPSNQMRIGQVRLPRADGDSADGEMSISPAMGTLEANVKRWSEQFTEKPEPVLTKKQVGSFQVTLVDLEGTFTGGGGPMAKASAPAPGTKMVGAILRIPGSEQMLFIKAWGPKATLEKWRPSIEQFVGTLRAPK